ncbi:hypothetical protein ABS768_17510 [Flavobacterium sp. ST-75]|uniref:Lipoprotein n=1 Tax=Flavobacterium rhizophilum TaxID=3163296 RepID=A0ABW8YJ74_9FLAO
MHTKIFLFITIFLLVSCKTSKNVMTFDKENVDKVEIEINKFKIPLKKNLINDFIKDFNRNELVYSDKKNTYLLDLIIYTKDGEIIYLKSNGANVFYNKSFVLVNSENLISKYWQIEEENLPHIKAPEPR